MILVMGRFTVNPASRDAFLAFARALVEQERAAEGCMGFDIYEDIAAPNHFLMTEQWISLAAFEHHADTAEAEEIDRQFESFLEGDPSFDTYEF